MRKNFGPKSWIYPMPVLIVAAYDEQWVPNAMNAAWGGISEMNEISICISDTHKTTKNILLRGAFTVSIADAEHVVACDYVGITSGNRVPDKFAKAGFHATKSKFVEAPIIDELPMTLECRVKSFDPVTCRLVGEIVNVCADERILGEAGMIDLNKFSPITYDPVSRKYYTLGEQVGYAYSDGKKI